MENVVHYSFRVSERVSIFLSFLAASYEVFFRTRF